MSLPAARGFVVFLLVVQVVQGLDVWGVTYSSTEICAVKGSTAEIRCRFTYPSRWKDKANRVEKTFWFTKHKDGEPVDLTTDAEYAGRVEDLCGNNICTLRIRNLRESDSAQYRFRITTNQDVYAGEPVTLSVTGFQVKVSNIYRYIGYIWATLECLSSCPPTSRPSYIWYKNGLKWTETRASLNNHLYPKESYACAVKGYENSPSPSVCVNGQACNTVAYSERSICAFKGSSVDISCTYSSNEYVQSKFWFSPERRDQDLSTHSQYAGRVQILETRRGSTLRISDLRDSDSAQYLFKFKTPSFEWRSDLPGTTLTVTALQVQVITATVQQSDTLAELKCQSSCSPAGGVSYVWFKNGEKIPTTTRSSYKGLLHHADRIYCAFEGHEDFPSPAVYAPKPPSVSVRPSAEIKEGTSVTLTCSSDANPAANYTWYKDDEDSPKASGPIFNITDFRAEHSGSYSCGTQNKLGRSNSTLTLIDVAGSMKSVAAGSIIAVIVGIIFLIAFLLIRRKRSSRPTTEAGERPDNDAQVRMYDCPSAEVQNATPEPVAEVCYASVRFIKNQDDALYSNIKPAHLRRHKKDEKDTEEDVDHSTVTFKGHSATAESERHEAAEDPSALYSVVNKKPRVLT